MQRTPVSTYILYSSVDCPVYLFQNVGWYLIPHSHVPYRARAMATSHSVKLIEQLLSSLAISGYCTSLIDLCALYTLIFTSYFEPLLVKEASFDFTIISFTLPSSQSMSESCISTLDTLPTRFLTLLCEPLPVKLKVAQTLTQTLTD